MREIACVAIHRILGRVPTVFARLPDLDALVIATFETGWSVGYIR